VLFAKGRFAAAGGCMIFAGLCDLLDGPVARRQDRVSLFGGFLDSILDRYADLILFLGLLVYYAQVNRFRYAVLAGAAMAGSVMVSYAKARAESLVPTSEIGFWERPERLVLMILGALTNRIDIALWLLAIGPNITVIHRILHTWKQTRGAKLAPVPMPLPNSSAPKPRDASPILTHSAGRGRI
jgi:CDP-diacylglycerol--glycerol-3-phosphate 3-phosphatidyltransferase